MVASFVIGTIAYGVYFSFGLFYPLIIAEYGWSRAVVSGAFSISLATYSIFAIPMGFLVDRFGPRVAVIVGGVFFGAGTWLGSRVDQPWHLYALYGIITAIGMGAAYIPLVATVSRWFVRLRGFAVGIASLGSGAGTFFVTPVVAQLIGALGWRAAYAAVGIGAGLAIILFGLLLWRDPADLGLKPYGAETAPAASATEPDPTRSLGPASALRTVDFWVESGMFALWWFGSLMVYVLGVDYALSRGADATTAPLLLTAIGLGNAVGKVVWGALSDRLGPRLTFFLATALEVAMMVILIFVRDPWLLIATASIFAFGFGGGSPSFPTLTAEFFGYRSLGLIFGLLFALVGIGGAFGPVVGGFLFDQTASYSAGFAVGALALAGSLLLNRLLPPPRFPSYEPRATSREPRAASHEP